jgi:hypothetical protein
MVVQQVLFPVQVDVAFNDNKQLANEFLQAMRKMPGGATAQRDIAVAYWAQSNGLVTQYPAE